MKVEVKVLGLRFLTILWCHNLGGVFSLSFLREPDDQIAVQGKNVTLYCIVDGDVKASSIQWNRNGNWTDATTLPPGYKSKSKLLGGQLKGTLTFPTEKRDSYEGQYHCVVTSRKGSIRSQNAWIKAKRITSMPKVCGHDGSLDITVATNETVAVQQRGYFVTSDAIWKVSCASNRSLTYDMSTLSQQLSQYLRIEYQSTLFVSLHNLQTKTPTNCSRFSIESLLPGSNRSVIVEFSDNFHVSKNATNIPHVETVVALVGSNVTLECLENHMIREQMLYEWRKDGHKMNVTKNGRIRNPSGRVLEITNVTVGEAGNYSCRIVNASHPRYSVLIQLAVLVHPFVSMSVSQIGQTDVNVTCTVWGARPLTLFIVHNASIWKRVSVKQDSSSHVSSTLNLTESGYIQCLISNNYGSYQKETYVEIVQHFIPTSKFFSSTESRSRMSISSLTITTTGDVSTHPIHTKVPTSPTKQSNHDDSDDRVFCLGIIVISIAMTSYVILLTIIFILVCMLCQRRKRDQAKETVEKSVESSSVHANVGYVDSYPFSSSLNTESHTDSHAQFTSCQSPAEKQSEENQQRIYDVPTSVVQKPAISTIASGYRRPSSNKANQMMQGSEYANVSNWKNVVQDGQTTDDQVCYMTMHPIRHSSTTQQEHQDSAS